MADTILPDPLALGLATEVGHLHRATPSFRTLRLAETAQWILIRSRPTAGQRIREGEPVEAVLAQIDAEALADARLLGLPEPLPPPPPSTDGFQAPPPVFEPVQGRRVH